MRDSPVLLYSQVLLPSLPRWETEYKEWQRARLLRQTILKEYPQAVSMATFVRGWEIDALAHASIKGPSICWVTLCHMVCWCTGPVALGCEWLC